MTTLANTPIKEIYRLFGVQTKFPISWGPAPIQGANLQVARALLPHNWPVSQSFLGLMPSNSDWFPFAGDSSDLEGGLYLIGSALCSGDSGDEFIFTYDPITQMVRLQVRATYSDFLRNLGTLYGPQAVVGFNGYDTISPEIRDEVDMLSEEFYDDGEYPIDVIIGDFDDTFNEVCARFAKMWHIFTTKGKMPVLTQDRISERSAPRLIDWAGASQLVDWADMGCWKAPVFEAEYKVVKSYLEAVYGYKLSELVLTPCTIEGCSKGHHPGAPHAYYGQGA